MTRPPARQSVLIVGAGAIGLYSACLLARAGHAVTVLVRSGAPPWGNTVEVLDGPDAGTAPIGVTDAPSDAADLVVVAVKSYDTDAAVRAAAPAVVADTTMIELQNGVDRAEAVDAVVGAGRTLAATIYLECARDAPGVVRYLSGPRRIHVGEPSGAGLSDRAIETAALLRDAGFDAHAHADVRPELWRKLAIVCAANSLTALTRRPFGDILGDPLGPPVVRGIITEACDAARGLGIDLPRGVEDESLDLLQALGPRLRSSMLRDVQAGHETEVDALNGHVVRAAAATGRAAPRNELVTLALRAHHSAGDRP